MSSPVGNSISASFSQAIASGDIQTAMQMVQNDRVRLLDSQLLDQVKAVQSRNDQIAKLNNVLSGLNSFVTQIDGKDAGSKAKDKDWSTEKVKQYEIPLNDAIKDAGITDLGLTSRSGQRTPQTGETKDAQYTGKLITGTNVVMDSTTRGEIEAAITKVKGMIDAESNNQQMDMLRLQSLNNKKSESVEILTGTQKKHSDSTSGIIRNF